MGSQVTTFTSLPPSSSSTSTLNRWCNRPTSGLPSPLREKRDSFHGNHPCSYELRALSWLYLQLLNFKKNAQMCVFVCFYSLDIHRRLNSVCVSEWMNGTIPLPPLNPAFSWCMAPTDWCFGFIPWRTKSTQVLLLIQRTNSVSFVSDDSSEGFMTNGQAKNWCNVVWLRGKTRRLPLTPWHHAGQNKV